MNIVICAIIYLLGILFLYGIFYYIEYMNLHYIDDELIRKKTALKELRSMKYCFGSIFSWIIVIPIVIALIVCGIVFITEALFFKFMNKFT
nr:MAG TPA: hypothetical protein [Crassvirales sp.]